MKKHTITLGGLPGSGKSTAKKILAEKLGYKTFSTGDFVRDMAHERGISLEEFNDIIANDKSLDLMIDERLKQIEAEEDYYVIDSHLAFHFVPSSFSVFLSISLQTSAERIFNDLHSESRIKSRDTMESLDEAVKRTHKRIENHIERYMRHYGINPYVENQYAHVIRTEKKKPEDVAREIHDAYLKWLAE